MRRKGTLAAEERMSRSRLTDYSMSAAPSLDFIYVSFHILFLIFKPMYFVAGSSVWGSTRVPVLVLISFTPDGVVRDHKYGNMPSLDPLPAPTGTGSDKEREGPVKRWSKRISIQGPTPATRNPAVLSPLSSLIDEFEPQTMPDATKKIKTGAWEYMSGSTTSPPRLLPTPNPMIVVTAPSDYDTMTWTSHLYGPGIRYRLLSILKVLGLYIFRTAHNSSQIYYNDWHIIQQLWEVQLHPEF